MLVTVEKMLLAAQRGRYAIGAFNIENMETAQAIISAAAETLSPVILQTTPSTVRYGDLKLFAGMVKALAEEVKIPVALQLDHGSDYTLAVNAVKAGYSTVMIDGSQLCFEENIALSKQVNDECKKYNIPVEAELGKVGGKEDDTESSEVGYTDPDEAVEFVKRTGVFSLAIGIGTAHGVYEGTPKLDIPRVGLIAAKVSNPLVLHGTSGIPDDDVLACIALGICKVNYCTELRIGFTNAIKEALAAEHEKFDPKFYLEAGRKKVKEIVKQRIKILGSEGKADECC